VFEYEHLDDSITAGGEVRLFNFPHRFFLDFDFENSEDYFTDLRYAYGDLILFRYVLNSIYHNLENIRLQDYDSLTANPGVGPNGDAGVNYGINARDHKFHLVVKAPRFPLHVYVDGFYMVKDGDTQQRNMLGSGLFNSMLLTSRARGVDTATRIYTVGVNSHLGLVEADFSHTEKRFDVNRDPALVDIFTPTVFRPEEGEYEHSRVPELEGSGNALKVHSSYTGKVVASATLSQNKRENNSSGAESEVITGSGSVTWSPLTSLTLALRYTHRDLDNKSPATVTVAKLDPPPAWSDTYAVVQPVSTDTDTLTLTGRYKPTNGTTFRAKYQFQKVDRTNAGLWNLTESSTKNSIILTAGSRLSSKVLLKARYGYQNISDPAYNTDPEHSHQGRIGLTWLPASSVSLMFSYDFNHQERDNLNFITSPDPWYREVDLNNTRVIGTYQISKNVSLSGSYSYQRYEVMQDLVYEDLGGVFQVVRDQPADQRAHVFTAGLHYRLSDALNLFGEITATRGEGEFSPSAADLLQPVSVGSFSKMEYRYLLLHLGAEYKFSDSLGFDFEYRFGDFEDQLINVYDDIEDGDAHIVTVTATKKW
jgi:hypothetical protein